MQTKQCDVKKLRKIVFDPIIDKIKVIPILIIESSNSIAWKLTQDGDFLKKKGKMDQ